MTSLPPSSPLVSTGDRGCRLLAPSTERGVPRVLYRGNSMNRSYAANDRYLRPTLRVRVIPVRSEGERERERKRKKQQRVHTLFRVISSCSSVTLGFTAYRIRGMEHGVLKNPGTFSLRPGSRLFPPLHRYRCQVEFQFFTLNRPERGVTDV